MDFEDTLKGFVLPGRTNDHRALLLSVVVCVARVRFRGLHHPSSNLIEPIAPYHVSMAQPGTTSPVRSLQGILQGGPYSVFLLKFSFIIFCPPSPSDIVLGGEVEIVNLCIVLRLRGLCVMGTRICFWWCSVALSTYRNREFCNTRPPDGVVHSRMG